MSKYYELNKLTPGKWYNMVIEYPSGTSYMVDLLLREWVRTEAPNERELRFYFEGMVFTDGILNFSAEEVENPFSGKLI